MGIKKVKVDSEGQVWTQAEPPPPPPTTEFKCEYCGKSGFTNKAGFMGHVSTVHAALLREKAEEQRRQQLLEHQPFGWAPEALAAGDVVWGPPPSTLQGVWGPPGVWGLIDVPALVHKRSGRMVTSPHIVQKPGRTGTKGVGSRNVHTWVNAREVILWMEKHAASRGDAVEHFHAPLSVIARWDRDRAKVFKKAALEDLKLITPVFENVTNGFCPDSHGGDPDWFTADGGAETFVHNGHSEAEVMNEMFSGTGKDIDLGVVLVRFDGRRAGRGFQFFLEHRSMDATEGLIFGIMHTARYNYIGGLDAYWINYVKPHFHYMDHVWVNPAYFEKRSS